MTTTNEKILNWATQLQGHAQNGLLFSQNSFDIDRYEKIRTLAAEMFALVSQKSSEEIQDILSIEKGYATPKVDVRAIIFQEDKILLVKETMDGLWSVPGGWVDLTQSPREAVEREVFEESGFTARALKLLAFYDMLKHKHPHQWPHIYKCFFLCEVTGGVATKSHETSAVEFFPVDNLPALSLNRVLPEQILHFYKYRDQTDRPTEFD